MKLRDWMNDNEVTCQELGDQMGVNISTVSRICNGSLNARRSVLRSIVLVTKGEVTADDLLDVPTRLRKQ